MLICKKFRSKTYVQYSLTCIRKSILFSYIIVVEVTFWNDSIVGHRQGFNDAAQFTISLPEDGSESLCYGMHGSPDGFYNIISDTCTSVNVHFTQHPSRSNANRISSIGIHAVTGDADTPCADIQIDLLGCRATINNGTINESCITRSVDVKRFSSGWKVIVPNCEHPHAVMWITCEEDMLRFDVSRASNLNSSPHGLLGKQINHRISRVHILTMIIIAVLHCYHSRPIRCSFLVIYLMVAF